MEDARGEHMNRKASSTPALEREVARPLSNDGPANPRLQQGGVSNFC
jgi:hypothetical protein